MKNLIAIVIASFALTAFAAEPAKPAEPAKVEKKEGKLKLAKKKDHSKDANKSPADKKPKADDKKAK